MSFEYLQGGSFHNVSVQPVPLLSHPHNKKGFAADDMKPPCLGLGWDRVNFHK